MSMNVDPDTTNPSAPATTGTQAPKSKQAPVAAPEAPKATKGRRGEKRDEILEYTENFKDRLDDLFNGFSKKLTDEISNRNMRPEVLNFAKTLNDLTPEQFSMIISTSKPLLAMFKSSN